MAGKTQLLERDDEISDSELSSVLDKHSPSDLDPHPSDAPYAHVLDDLLGDDLEEGVLSTQSRQKLASRMRAMASKLTRMRSMKRFRMAPSARLQYRARKAAIMALRRRVAGDRGKRYSDLSPSERVQIDKQVLSRFGKNFRVIVTNAARRLLPMIRRKESERLRVARANESYKPGYYKGLASSTKRARHAHFARQTKMSDDDPAAYKKAPGDDRETRMSKHTRKYHSVYEGRKSAHGGTDDDPQDNIVYQMRKVINLRGKHKVKFADGSTMDMHPDHARHIISRYMAQPKPLDKHKFVRRLGASSTNMRKELGDQFSIDKDLPVSSDPREFPVRSSYLTSGKKPVREGMGYRVTGRATDFVPQNAPEFPPTSHAIPTASMETEADEKAAAMAKDRSVGTLLRLGLAKPDDATKIQKWLKSDKGKSMSSAMRDKLLGVLDKLMGAAADDPQFISRVRTKHLDMREDVATQIERERSALSQRHEREREALHRRMHAKKAADKKHKETLAKSRSSSYLKADVEHEISEAADRGLQKKAEKSGIPVGILRKVYNRGMAAWKTGHRPGANQQQWAYARVNSFITKGKGTWGGADKDLASQVREEVEAVDEATISRRKYTVGKPMSSYKPIAKGSGDMSGFKGVDWKKATDSVLADLRREREARAKKPVAEAAGIGTDELRQEYAAATPGQRTGEVSVSHVSAPKPWEVDEQAESTRDIGKSVRTWEQVRTVLSGRKNVSEAFVAGIDDAPFAREVGFGLGGKTFEHHPSVVEEAKEECPGCKDCEGVEEELRDYQDVDEENITHKGRAIKLGAVTKSNRPNKKRMVHVRNDKGNVVTVHFGDPNLEIKRDNPERRRNFRARHNCSDPGPRWKAKYWSCRYWSKTPVSKM